MGLFRNTDIATRVWPGLTAADGSTLRLGPGQEADVDLPDGFEDHWLRPAPKARAAAVGAAPKTEKPTEPAASAVDPKE